MSTKSKKTLRLYTPHEKQLEFHNAPTRFRVACFGRQAGKSTACLNDLIYKAWTNPGTTYWYVSPTYDQAQFNNSQRCRRFNNPSSKKR